MAYLDKLGNKEILNYEKKRPNDQIYKTYINIDNNISQIFVELEEFRKSYSNLLNKSKDRIESKDYSSFAKLYNLENDPAKWKREDQRNYMMVEMKMMDKVLRSDSNSITWFAKFFKENNKRLANQIEESFQELAVLQEIWSTYSPRLYTK